MGIFSFKTTASLRMLTDLIFLLTINNKATVSLAFTIPHPSMQSTTSSGLFIKSSLMVIEGTNDESNQVVELVDNDNTELQQQLENNEIASKKPLAEIPATVSAPFLSQGKISEEAMDMNWNDPKQTRVMFYIILSLLPVLFLIPLMLGSRDLIPPDALPPVEIN